MKIVRWILGTLLVLAAAAAAAMLAFAPQPIPHAVLLEKYGGSQARFLTLAGGTEVHYRDQGRRDAAAPVLVLLHGSNASLHTWEPWVQVLGTDARVVTVDLPGHGLTGATVEADYSAAGMAAFVEAFTRALGIEGRFVLAGNSMGGHVAWRYALRYPDRLSHLVLLAPAGVTIPGEEREPPLAFRLAMNPVAQFFLRRISSRGLFERTLRLAYFDPSLSTPEMLDRYWELNRRPGTADATFARFRLPYSDAEAVARMGEIRTPTLVLWGHEDAILPARLADVFVQRIPHARVVLYDRVGHLPMEEIAERSAGDLRAFIAAGRPQ